MTIECSCAATIASHTTSRPAVSVASKTRKRKHDNKEERELVTVNYTMPRKSYFPVVKTHKLLYDLIRMPADEMQQSIGIKGIIVTEQLLVTNKEGGKMYFEPWAFLFIKIDGTSQLIAESTNYKNIVKTFASFSKPLLIGGANTTKEHSKPMSQDELICHLIEREKRLPLLCIAALATGRNDFAHLDRKTGQGVGVVLACGMATDLIIRANRPNDVGPSVRYMSNMIRHASDRQLHESLARTRVTTSPSAALKSDARGFIKACLEPSVKLQPRALNLHQADNLNLKVTQGDKAGSVMSLTLTAHRIPSGAKVKRETTIYADNKPLHLRTSRERKQ